MPSKMEKLTSYIAPVTSSKSRYYQPSPDYKKQNELEKEIADLKAGVTELGAWVLDHDETITELASMRAQVDQLAETNARLMAQYEAAMYKNLEEK